MYVEKELYLSIVIVKIRMSVENKIFVNPLLNIMVDC